MRIEVDAHGVGCGGGGGLLRGASEGAGGRCLKQAQKQEQDAPKQGHGGRDNSGPGTDLEACNGPGLRFDSLARQVSPKWCEHFWLQALLFILLIFTLERRLPRKADLLVVAGPIAQALPEVCFADRYPGFDLEVEP